MSNVVRFRPREPREPRDPGFEPEDPGGAKPSWQQRLRASPVTAALSAINIAYFLWVEQHGSTHDHYTLVRFGAVETSLVHAGEYWRMATYAVLHIGWAHLIMNTWAGWSWSVTVERVLGHARFFAIYTVAALGGGAAVVLFSDATTAGASGAMFGIIGAILVILFRTHGNSFDRFQRDPSVRSTVAQIALWTAIGLVGLKMSNSGHFGGLITGGLCTIALTEPRSRRRLALGAFAIAFVGFLVYAAQPWNRGAPADLSSLPIDRFGRIKNEAVVIPQLAPACAKGNERACIVRAILDMQPADKESAAKSRPIFEAGCAHRDPDACAALGILVSEKDVFRGERMIHEACAAGSEWGCEFSLPEIPPDWTEDDAGME